MNEKSELLRQLRLDRAEPDAKSDPGGSGSGRGRLLAIVVLVLLLAGAAAFWALSRPGASSIRVAVARALPPSPGNAGGASILDASGYVVARRQATVSAKLTGKLEQLFIEDGQHVKAGEILARLDDTNAMAALGQAKAAVAQAEAAVAQARTAAEDIAPTYERNRQQAAAGLISAEALEASKSAFDAQASALRVAEANLAVQRAGLEVAQRNENDTVVRAPYAGVITSKNAQPGEIISPFSAGGAFTRTGIGTLVDMDSLEVEVEVNENFISRVHADAPAILKLNAYPDWQIPATVIAVVPTADRSKATVKVRVGFKSRDPRILPEMGARVSFLDPPAKAGASPAEAQRANEGVVVPQDAVMAAAGTASDTGVVFVVHDDRVERRAVRLGARGGDGQIVLAGLSSGERVAVGELGALSDGMRVRVTGP
jgi:RND family efflux transporter MFP subunit